MSTATPARLAAGGAGLALRRGRLAAAAAVPADHPARRQGQHRGDRVGRVAGTGGSSGTCARPPGSRSPSRGGTRRADVGPGRTVYVDQSNLRPEARLEDPAQASNRPRRRRTSRGRPAAHRRSGRTAASRRRRELPRPRRPARGPHPDRPGARRPATWTEPDVAERPASYAIYRPATGDTTRESAPPAGAHRGEVTAMRRALELAFNRVFRSRLGVALVLASSWLAVRRHRRGCSPAPGRLHTLSNRTTRAR